MKCGNCDYLKPDKQCEYNVIHREGVLFIPSDLFQLGGENCVTTSLLPHPKHKDTPTEHEFTNLNWRLYDMIQLGPCSDEYVQEYLKAGFSPDVFWKLSDYSPKPLGKLLNWILCNPAVKAWCLEKGVIRVREVPETEVFYKRGDYFKNDPYIYRITRAGGQKCILTRADDGDNIYGISNGVSVQDTKRITMEEFKQLTGGMSQFFTKINVEITEV